MTLTFTLKLLCFIEIAFSTLLPPGAHCSVSKSALWFFIRPFSDGSYYGRVMSARVSVRPFFAFFSYMLWHIELKFCTWLSFNVLRIKFECRHFVSIFKELCLFVNSEYRKCAVFRTFLLNALTNWADILHLIFVLMYYRSRSTVVILHKFLKELCLFVNLEYRKYAVSRNFLLHTLTYWSEILHMTLV